MYREEIMESKLVIIRGNSGSGKIDAAKPFGARNTFGFSKMSFAVKC